MIGGLIMAILISMTKIKLCRIITLYGSKLHGGFEMNMHGILLVTCRLVRDVTITMLLKFV